MCLTDLSWFKHYEETDKKREEVANIYFAEWFITD